MPAAYARHFARLAAALRKGASGIPAHRPIEPNGSTKSAQSDDCGETTFTASITDPTAGHKVDNMYLVVDLDDSSSRYVNVPIDGGSASITVGPFYTGSVETETISWRVFGGGERVYDSPLWNGFGSASFTCDIIAYADSVGGYSWVVAGTDDPNPFTTWHEVDVDTCEITKDLCKSDFEVAGFRNQGLCIRFANTGRDSR